MHEKRYTLCKRGHIRSPDNLTTKGQCKLCAKLLRRKRYVKNREHEKSLTKQWISTNKERHAESRKNWSKNNKELHSQLIKEWVTAHKEKWARDSRNRRARKREAAGWTSAYLVAEKMRYYGNRCVYCGGPFQEVDHAIPLSRGGANWTANLRPSCKSCNRRKWTKTLIEFAG